jgi:hypothetical protein
MSREKGSKRPPLIFAEDMTDEMMEFTIETAKVNQDKKARPDTTRHDKTRQDKAKQDKTRQDKTRQDKARQDKTRQDKTKPVFAQGMTE